MPRPKKELREKMSKTADYITAKLDETDWNELLKEHDYCRRCPSRAHPEILDDGRINDLCMACPLRQWLMVTFELAARQRMARSEALAARNGEDVGK